ncbi:hypothetical protein MO973_40360 [Paenibacillus sp. TRM 82003]|nr:hypothetical protein [Paenibacillus sp. TRM 82003]
MSPATHSHASVVAAEDGEPVGEAVGPVGGEAGDVVGAAGGQHEADRRHVKRAEAAAGEDDVDQRAAGVAFAVGEGVDGLELRVGDRRLHERGVPVGLQVGGQVVQQRRHLAGRRGTKSARQGL